MPIRIDRLLRTRRKTVALVVERDGSLTVRAPLRLSEERIRRFVEDHADWIARNQGRVRKHAPPPPKEFKDGEEFIFLGQKYPLLIVPPQRPGLKFDGKNFKMAASAVPKAQETFVRWYKLQAASFLSQRILELSSQLGYRYKKIRITSARTRWGSCSSIGTLSFTWRLIMAPPTVIDYVVIHELVHTRIKNHSREFWAQVGQHLPEYKTYVRWLKQNGRFLTL